MFGKEMCGLSALYLPKTDIKTQTWGGFVTESCGFMDITCQVFNNFLDMVDVFETKVQPRHLTWHSFFSIIVSIVQATEGPISSNGAVLFSLVVKRESEAQALERFFMNIIETYFNKSCTYLDICWKYFDRFDRGTPLQQRPVCWLRTDRHWRHAHNTEVGSRHGDIAVPWLSLFSWISSREQRCGVDICGAYASKNGFSNNLIITGISRIAVHRSCYFFCVCAYIEKKRMRFNGNYFAKINICITQSLT